MGVRRRAEAGNAHEGTAERMWGRVGTRANMLPPMAAAMSAL